MKEEKKHILVVDDDTRICDLLEKFLNKNGYLISTVHNAEKARRLLLSLEFDLIILDVMTVSYTHLTLPTNDQV